MEYIKKEDLEEWAYYIGYCRNASIAMWANSKWHYLREKFGSIFDDRVEAIEDFEGFDIFVPVKKIDDSLWEEAFKIYNSLSNEELKKLSDKSNKK